MPSLRPYQIEAVAALLRDMESDSLNPVVAMPTGSGKSVVIGGFCWEMRKRFPGIRILVASHTLKITEQNSAFYDNNYEKSGVYHAGLKRFETNSDVIFCGIHSVYNKVPQLGHFDLLIIDECHLVSNKDDTMYATLIKELKELNPLLPIAGLSATPYRCGMGSILDNGIFTNIAYDLTTSDKFLELLDEGYLAELHVKDVRTKVNLDGLRITAGDYNQKDLEERYNVDAVTQSACEEIVASSGGRLHWLLFSSGIKHAEAVTLALRLLGVSAEYVHSKMPADQVNDIINAHQRGDFTALVNNGILTTGYDFRGIDLIAVLRATASVSLWVQMLGRGMRPLYAPGYSLETREGRFSAQMASEKPHGCLVFDFGRNCDTHGPINHIVPPQGKKRSKPGDAPVKICPKCGVYAHASVRVCKFCDYAFPFDPTGKLSRLSGSSAVISRGSNEKIIEEHFIKRVVYSKHVKNGSDKATLKVTYFLSDITKKPINQFVCFEHAGIALREAQGWWQMRSPEPVPTTVDDALQLTKTLRTPSRATIEFSGSWPSIRGVSFG